MNRTKFVKSFLKFALVLPMLLSISLVSAKTNDPLVKSNPVVVGGLGFNELSHEFGSIKESDGDASAVFTFVNNTTKPVVISNVSAACGCTTPEWTKEPIAPGATGSIKATYGAKGRVGAFDKTVSVTTSADPATVVLRIKGTVVGN